MENNLRILLRKKIRIQNNMYSIPFLENIYKCMYVYMCMYKHIETYIYLYGNIFIETVKDGERGAMSPLLRGVVYLVFLCRVKT